MTDWATLQAANLRVSWETRDVNGMLTQVANVTSLEEAHDLIVALTMTAGMSSGVLRNVLSEGF
jgi:hypothetical protein